MKKAGYLTILLIMVFLSCKSDKEEKVETILNSGDENVALRFNLENDLLLAHFDCKTDVDDIHTAAALATLMADPQYKNLKVHVVAGAYGVQEGLYVPANDLFEMAFGSQWSDAHTDFDKAVSEVKAKVIPVLQNGGHIWIADGGQSDFSASLIKEVLSFLPEINAKEKIHVVQHSDWNEEVTTKEDLAYVTEAIDYHKIPDGNAEGNGTPGFRSPDFNETLQYIKDDNLSQIWNLALEIGTKYNGKDGRYNNEAVANGGVDFSDLSETCYILNLEIIKDSQEFFEKFGY